MNFKINPKAWLAALVAVMLLLVANGATIVYISVIAEKAIPSFLENSFSLLVAGFLGLLANPKDKNDDASKDDDSSQS